MKDKKLDIKSLKHKAAGLIATLQRYGLAAFIILVLGIYGFVMMRITTLNAAEPSDDQVTSQVKAVRVPRIDDKVVQQLNSLEDNSVSVKALFDEARSNPFQ